MSGLSHPATYAMVAAQRRAELHAEADRYRLQRLAQQRTGRLHPWADFAAMVAVVVAVVLVLASSAPAAPPRQPARQHPRHADGQVVSQVLNEHLLDPSAARQVQAARL